MLLTLHFHPLLQPMTGVKAHTFAVDSLSDIKDALSVLFPKIRKYIRQISAGTLRENLSLITPEGNILNRKDYYTNKIENKELTLVPVIAGAGGRGLGIILGIVLIAAAVFLGGAPLALGGTGAGFVGSTTALGGLVSAGGLLKMGIGLVLSGLMQMLMKPPEMKGPSDTAQRRNNDMFDALDNTTDPSTSIPLIYGMPRVAGQMLSGHVETISHGESDTIYVIDLLYKNRSELTKTG
jgi:predicted phage tail protein